MSDDFRGAKYTAIESTENYTVIDDFIMTVRGHPRSLIVDLSIHRKRVMLCDFLLVIQ